MEPLEDILDAETAEVLSCALQHQRYEGNLTDPYFTEEHWRAVVKKRTALLDEAEELVEEIVSSSKQVQDKGREWLGRKRTIPLCTCKAHKCRDEDFFTNVVGELVKLQPPDTGAIFADDLLSHILKAAHLTRIKFRGTRGGTREST